MDSRPHWRSVIPVEPGPDEACCPGVMLLAAHPDDETIGAGGVLPHLRVEAVVYVTDGAPRDRRWWGAPHLASRQAYAALRRRELAHALAAAGVGPERVERLGRRDQRASFGLARLVRQLAARLRALRPGLLLTHAYEGGHPDHDATAFAAHAAVALLRREGEMPPVVVEFTGYHAAPVGIATGAFLPGEAGGVVVEVPLAEADRARKRRMLACFASQRETLAQFTVGSVERFRRAPAYDFARAPHPGTLFYERFAWGTTGAAWRVRAARAQRALARDPAAAPCG